MESSLSNQHIYQLFLFPSTIEFATALCPFTSFSRNSEMDMHLLHVIYYGMLFCSEARRSSYLLSFPRPAALSCTFS